MRVSWEFRFQTLETGFRRLQQRLAGLHTELATGKQLNSLADNPTAVYAAYRLQELLEATDRRLRTLQAIVEEAQVVQTHTEALSTALQEVSALLTAALDPQHLDKPVLLAQQLRQRLDDIVALANAQYNGRLLFGGTATNLPDGKAFLLERTAPSPQNPSGMTVNFRGTMTPRQVFLFPGQPEDVGLQADELFGDGGVELFTLLITVYNLLAYRSDGSQRAPEESLNSTERAQVVAFMSRLADFRQRIDRATARMGARQERWQLLQEQLEQYATFLRGFRSTLEESDIVQVAVQLQKEQIALQALLSGFSRLLGLSLFDYLR